MKCPSAVVICCAACFLCSAAQVIPLSRSTYGASGTFQRGEQSSEIMVEIYIDLACTDSASAWDDFTRLYHTYKTVVNFQYRVFPLPYHNSAFVLSKAAYVVDRFGSESTSVFTFIDTVFANQQQILNNVTASMTFDEVIALVSNWATHGTGLTTAMYDDGMVDDNVEMNTRYMWKYCTLRSVYGTPTVFINGLETNNISFKDVSEALDDLLNEVEPASSPPASSEHHGGNFRSFRR